MRVNWLMLLNFLAQFMFVRIFVAEELDASFPRWGYDVYRVRYGIMFFVVPLTGWWGRYASIGNYSMKYITGVRYQVRRSHE